VQILDVRDDLQSMYIGLQPFVLGPVGALSRLADDFVPTDIDASIEEEARKPNGVLYPCSKRVSIIT